MRNPNARVVGLPRVVKAWFLVVACMSACSSKTEDVDSHVDNDRTTSDGTRDTGLDGGGSVVSSVTPLSDANASNVTSTNQGETSDAVTSGGSNSTSSSTEIVEPSNSNGTDSGAGFGAGTADGGAYFTPEEQADLQVLTADASVLEDAHGQALVELASAVGYARGLAVCRCTSSFAADDERVHDCAVAEALSLWVFTEASRRPFAVEWIVEHPEFEADLRCRIRLTQLSGWQEAAQCTNDSGPPEENACEVSPAFYDAIEQLRVAANCPDGTRVYAPRCNSKIDCEDLSDERNCFEELGRDVVLCNGTPLTPYEMCFGPDPCASETTPPMCIAGMPGRFLCADGSDIDIQLACDRNDDCPDGSDEAPCLR